VFLYFPSFRGISLLKIALVHTIVVNRNSFASLASNLHGSVAFRQSLPVFQLNCVFFFPNWGFYGMLKSMGTLRMGFVFSLFPLHSGEKLVWSSEPPGPCGNPALSFCSLSLSPA
jgi:hypothetical protein